MKKSSIFPVGKAFQWLLGEDDLPGPEEVFADLPVLETERLVLRKVRYRDAEDLYRCCSDPEVARHALWEAHQSPRETRRSIYYMKRQYHMGLPSSYGICLKENGKVIGTIGFMNHSREHACAEVGYSMAREFWNRGLMTEALAAVIRMGFQYLGLNRIEASHETDNPASGRVMEKCGMKREGVLRQKYWNKDHFCDVVQYAILKEEAPGRQQGAE